MRLKSTVLLVAGALAFGFVGTAVADLTYTQGVGTTIFDFVCFTSKHCSAHTIIDSSGTEKATAGNPLRTDPVGTTTQPVSASSLPLPTGAATSANQPSNAAQASTTSGQTGTLVEGAVTTAAPTYTNAQTDPLSLTTAGALRTDSTSVAGTTMSTGAGAVGTGSQRVAVGQDTTTIAGSAPGTAGSASTNVLTVQGIASMTALLANPGTAANWGIGTSTQNSATVANGQLALAQFNTTPTTITTGNMSPLQMDNAGNLLVNIKAGAGSGGTALADEGAFTQGTTNTTPMGCLFINSYTALTTGHAGVVSCTNAGSVHTTVDNANANGQTTMSSSSPVVVASDQTGSCTGVIAINQTASTDLKTSTAKLNICSVVLVSASAQNISLVEGTGTTCATGTAALIGGTTASLAVAANGGFSSVAAVPWLKTQTTADHLCLLQSGAGNVSGVITYMDHS